MFEQTFVTGQTARKPGPLAASFAVQSAFVASDCYHSVGANSAPSI